MRIRQVKFCVVKFVLELRLRYFFYLGFQSTFTPVQEQALYIKIVTAQRRMQGLTRKQIRKLVFDYAEKLEVPHRFNKQKGLAGYDWVQKFMERHNLVDRKAEPTSKARANGFNADAVKLFFDELEIILKEKKIKPENIWNADETGITVNPKSASKIIAQKGLKQVGGLTQAERGETVTAEICLSAGGKFMPPMLIFPRVTVNSEYLAGAPPGAWGEFNGSGWISEELFTKWFQEYVKFSKPTEETDARLLLLDGHYSHSKNLDVIDLAEENKIEVLLFPPHCTHRMQPADVAFMKPLSSKYSEIIMAAQRQNKKVNMKNIFYYFGRAWQEAAKVETAVSAFEKTGIVPFNRDVFKPEDFVNLSKRVDVEG